MKFFIRRTTWLEDDESPYPGAFKEQFVYVDCVRKEYYDNAYIRDDSGWKETGENYRINGLWMEKDIKRMGWFIEVNSIEDLMKIIETSKNNIIISPKSQGAKDETIPEIEIYDDFRE